MNIKYVTLLTVLIAGLFTAKAANAQGSNDTLSISQTCFGDTTEFLISNYADIDTESKIDGQRWIFGESEQGDTAYTQSPKHLYSSSGDFTVNLEIYRQIDTLTIDAIVTIHPLPEVDLGADTTVICQNATLTLDAGAGMNSYLWSTGAAEQSIEAETAGTYWVTVTDANTCSNADTMELIVATPVLNLADAVVCDGQSTVLDAGEGFESYLWSNGSQQQTTTVTQAGAYSVTATDENGCQAEGSLNVELAISPQITNIEMSPVTPLVGGSIVVEVFGGAGNNQFTTENSGLSVFLGPQSSNDFSGLQKGNYTVTVTDANGCVDTAYVNIVSHNEEIEVAEAFTPNGDAINDSWQIKYLDIYEEAEVRLYNRWNKLVFYSKGIYQPWDGVYEGKYIESGTYYYHIDLKNGTEPRIGFITIIR